MRRILKAGLADGSDAAGVTLLETVCILAIMAMLAGAVLPAIPTSTTKWRLQGYAMQIASILSADRNAAIRERHSVFTAIELPSKLVRSGASMRVVKLPADVALSASLAERCGDLDPSSAIIFLGSGMSCGGSVALKHEGEEYEVRVNWLTGGIDIVDRSPS